MLINVMVAHVVSRDTWHSRLNHLAFEKLDMLNGLLNFPNNKRDGVHVPCLVCPLVKQRRLSFVSNNSMFKKAFNLIHYDT